MAEDNEYSPTNHRVYKVKKMHNGNLVDLVEQMDSTLVELLLSTSAQTPDFREADKVRIESYFASWEKLVKFMSADPELDAPQSHPTKTGVNWTSNQTEITDEDGEVQVINHNPPNNQIRSLTRDIRTLMGEMAMDSSRRMPNGISKHAKKRFEDHLAKARSYMSEYVEKVEPLDTPETDTAIDTGGHGHL